MAITTSEVGPDAWEARSKPKLWEKKVQDISNINESFAKARDIGSARLNYNRLTVVAELSKKDNLDYYKFEALSRGNLRITLRDSGEDSNSEGPLELDTNKYLKAAGISVPETDETEETRTNFEEILDSFKAKNVKMQLFTIKNGKEVEVANSAAEEDSKEFQAFEALSTGEYRLNKPDNFYIKISRLDESKNSDAYQYALQIQIGDEYKHDNVTTEIAIDKNEEYEGKKGAYVSSAGQAALDALTAYNVANLSSEAMEALSSQTSNSSASYNAGQAAASMLSGGYSNISSILDSDASTDIFGASSDIFDILKG